MGIYDRDYYRRDGPSFLDHITSGGYVCKWLIAINIVAFILQSLTLSQGHRFGSLGPVTDWLELDADKVTQGQVWRLLTYAFLHDPGNITHILFNMLFLWWFGQEVEETYGHREFLCMYLTAAVVSGLVYVFAYKFDLQKGSLAFGASGAVTAVMIVSACHSPYRTILLFFVLPVPIWLFVVFAVAKDFLGFFGARGIGMERVAASAHLGGAAFGFLYYRFQWRVSSWLPDVRSWWKARNRPQLRVYREEEEANEEAPVPVATAPVGADADEQLEAKLDAVLAKVSKHGKESLTENEQQILQRASEVYRRRRS
jgi:membrane associated rhomboid family serine protease